MKKYPEYVYKAMSARLGMTIEQANELPEGEVFDNLVTWNLGYSQWSDTIKDWIKDVYKIELS
nr:hypothetical protein [Paenibacillus xylanexedens]